MSILFGLKTPSPFSDEAAWIDVLTSFHDDEVIMDELYTGRTPRTVQDWRGFPLVDVEARLISATDRVDVQDFVWGDVGGDVIVSDRLLRIFQEEEITGIGTRTVTITSVEIGLTDLLGDPHYQPPKLHRLVAKGIVERVPPDIPRPHPDWPVVLDLETWNGLDFCVAWGAWMFHFVSQRFVDCLQRHSVHNYRVIPGEEFTFNGHRYIEFPSAYPKEDRASGQEGSR